MNSFKHAFEGLHWAFTNHKNFKIHLGISSIVLVMAYILPVTRIETILLLFTILLGFIVEMVNTALEEITNLVTIKWAHQARVAKDVAAAMMLLTACAATIIGFIIFYPYLL